MTEPKKNKRVTPKKDRTVTEAKDWKKSGKTAPEDLPLPSGNVALVRRPGMQAFLTEGLIPNSLIAPMMASLEEKDPSKQNDALKTIADEMLTNAEGINDMLSLVDAVTVACVVKPKVLAAPEDEEDRDPELLYVDEVDLDDKMFIFNFASGGTRDIERFRAGSATAVADLENVTALELPAQSIDGDD
jgi:hypothetical protein